MLGLVERFLVPGVISIAMSSGFSMVICIAIPYSGIYSDTNSDTNSDIQRVAKAIDNAIDGWNSMSKLLLVLR